MTNLTVIVPPTYLNNSVYVRGLRQPLEELAELLDEQNKPSYARSLRDVATICDLYAAIVIEKSATLIKQ